MRSRALTTPKKGDTLGGRDGSEAILAEETAWHLSPTPPPSGSYGARCVWPDPLERLMWRARRLALSAAMRAAEELEERLLEKGGFDDDA